MSRKATATARILEAFQAGDRITGHSALLRFGVYRLASIVHNLRNAGYHIVTTMKNEGGVRFAEYHLLP